MTDKKKIWVFASGSGSNAEKLFAYFDRHPRYRITGLLCNNPQAGVAEKAKTAGVPVFAVDNAELREPGKLRQLLTENGVDYIILAGFLRKIPDDVTRHYADRILNIHPALLPKFGGQGMYGMHVHRAVKEAGETETGITIHLVNEQYDKGRVWLQSRVGIQDNDSPEDIARKMQELEHRYFATACEAYFDSLS